MSNILALGKGNTKIITASTIEPPEGYQWYFTSDGNKTLMDARGRINISYLYNVAKQQDPNITNKKPGTWLVNKPAVEMRADYLTKLGYDPVNTIAAVKSTTFQDGNQTWTTTGTYMVDRMGVMYGAWVSPYFRDYMLDTYIIHANNPISAQGLILPTDDLHRENAAINIRHNMMAIDAVNVPGNLKIAEYHAYDIFTYNVELRNGFNIDSTVERLFKYFKYLGLFYLDGLLIGGDQYEMYLPKPEFVNSSPALFISTAFEVNGVIVTRVSITTHGHNCLIQQIVAHFGLIATER